MIGTNVIVLRHTNDLDDGKIQRFVHQSNLIVNKYFQNGEKYSEIAKQLNLNRYSVYVVVKRFNLREPTEIRDFNLPDMNWSNKLPSDSHADWKNCTRLSKKT